MQSDSAIVHRVRAVVLGVIRIVSVAMVGAGLVMVANRLLYGLLGVGDLSSGWQAWSGIGATHGVFLGLPMVGVGLALGILSERITRWAVRTPARGCAACGYQSVGEDGMCSECGYR